MLARRDIPDTGRHILPTTGGTLHHGTLSCRTRWRSDRALNGYGARSNQSRRREKDPQTGSPSLGFGDHELESRRSQDRLIEWASGGSTSPRKVAPVPAPTGATPPIARPTSIGVRRSRRSKPWPIEAMPPVAHRWCIHSSWRGVPAIHDVHRPLSWPIPLHLRFAANASASVGRMVSGVSRPQTSANRPSPCFARQPHEVA